jgi:hypothetical protein
MRDDDGRDPNYPGLKRAEIVRRVQLLINEKATKMAAVVDPATGEAPARRPPATAKRERGRPEGHCLAGDFG